MTRFIMFPSKNKEGIRIGKQLQAKARRNKSHRKNISVEGDAIFTQLNYYPRIIYMNQTALIEELTRVIQNDDVIELHAHGTPWIIGGQEESANDYTPYQLAAFFNVVFSFKKDLHITIELRSCNSGTIAIGHDGGYEICYARNLSEALVYFQLNHITVKGYTGYIQSENLFKQSIVEHESSSRAKFAHCRLEEGEAAYQNGCLVQAPKKVIISTFSYLNELEDSDLQQYLTDRKRFEVSSVDASCSSSSSSSATFHSEQEIPIISSATLCFMFEDLRIGETQNPPLVEEGIPSKPECRNSLS